MNYALFLLKSLVLLAYLVFLPGLAVSFLFWNRKQIKLGERIFLSFAISIVLVPLLSFYLYLLLGIIPNKENTFFEVAFVVLFSLILRGVKRIGIF